MKLRWIALAGLVVGGSLLLAHRPSRSAAAAPQVVYVPTTPVDDYDRFVPRGRCPMIGDYLKERLSEADADELRELVARWIEEPDWWQPAIGPRGVLHIESAEDLGDGPPAPPEAERVCGRHAGWLRSDLRARLDPLEGELHCDGNLCCYRGAEYRPSGIVAFRREADTWALDAWVQLDDTALSDDVVEANIDHVVTSIARVATRPACRP